MHRSSAHNLMLRSDLRLETELCQRYSCRGWPMRMLCTMIEKRLFAAETANGDLQRVRAQTSDPLVRTTHVAVDSALLHFP